MCHDINTFAYNPSAFIAIFQRINRAAKRFIHCILFFILDT